MIRVFMFGFLFSISALSLGAEKLPHGSVSYASTDKPLLVSAAHPEFELKLPSNPTTGFSWFLGAYDHHLIHAVSHKYIAPKKQLMGAGGYELWSFKVKKAAFVLPQQTVITMHYRRPWTEKQAKTQQFTVIIKEK